MSLSDPTTERLSDTGLPTPGELVGERYRIEEKLGAGGMGTVLAAQNTENGQPVAIKIMRAEEARHSDAAKRFMRELPRWT